MLKQYLIFFLCFLFLKVFSQAPIYYTIGENEFSNKDIYTLLYDENTEFIYVGTNNGLFVYKENSFHKFRKTEDQIGNSFFDLKQDDLGDIYCRNLNGQIFKLNQDKVELYFQLNEIERKSGQFWFFFTPEGHIFTASKFAVKIYSRNGKIIKEYKSEYTINQITQVTQTDQSIYFEVINNDKKTIVEYRNEKFNVGQTSKLNNNISSFIMEVDTNLFSISNSGLINYSNSIQQDFKPLNLERYIQFNDSTLLALNSQKGYRKLMYSSKKMYSSQTIFPNIFLSAFYKTNSNKQLFGTFGEGIIVVNTPEVIKYELDHLLLDIASSEDNNVGISTRSGEIFSIKNNKRLLVEKMNTNIDHIFHIGNHQNFKQLGYQDFAYSDVKGTYSSLKDLIVISDDIILFSSFAGLTIHIDSNLAKASNLDYTPENGIIVNGRYNALEWNAQDSIIYFASNLNLSYKKWTSDSIITYQYEQKPVLANDLELYNNQLFVGSTYNGVLVFNNTEFMYKIDKTIGLKSNLIRQIEIRDHNIYILTSKGLQVFDLKNKRFKHLKNKLIFDGVTDFSLSNDNLWLLEKHSYFSIPIDKLFTKAPNSKPLNIYLNKLIVNDSLIFNKPFTNTDFNFNQNRFEFIFDYRNVFNKPNTKILYQLEGLNKIWTRINASKNNILFHSLKPGKYTFKIKAEEKERHSEILEYTFVIDKPYWQKWWFYLSMALSLIGGLSTFFIIRIQKLKSDNLRSLEKQKLITNSIDSELKAIRAQMNPHFIFNAINSIQDLVLQNDSLKTYDSLVQFSKLVRNTLDYSEKEFIYLSQETAFLETYLSLEKLRFSTNFEYTIENSLDHDILVPSLIIQPFVENALKHGLLHKKGQKHLSIQFFNSENNTLICIVKDNGIGKIKSSEIKERQQRVYKSFSTNAIQKRFEILEQKFNKKYNFTTEDIVDEEGSTQGTLVKIVLPYLKE